MGRHPRCSGADFTDLKIIGDIARVLEDVIEKWVGLEAARREYGVALVADDSEYGVSVDCRLRATDGRA
ncbi:MAG: hypothetical protein ACHQAY_27360 [Hyphomicrobiales bacterium]